MNKVVRYAVDVPRNADRVDETENEHHPKGDTGKKIEHAEEISAVEKGGENRDCVQARVRKNPGTSRGTFDNCEFT